MEIEKRNPKIFIISGKARHGKDTTAMYMNEISVSYTHLTLPTILLV